MRDLVPRRTLASVLIGVLFCLVCTAIPSCAQSAATLSGVTTLYVGSFGSEKGAVATRSRVIRRLQKGRAVRVVSDPAKADAVVKGTVQIWTTGRVSLTPHSHSSVQPVVEGFLSVEVVGRNNQTLWSYLVTPSKFLWGGVTDDLARQLVSRLLGAVKEGDQPEAPITSASTNLVAKLNGAGATFPAPLYQKWFQLFQETHPSMHISYDAVGSAEGIRKLQQGEIDFGASEVPLTNATVSGGDHNFVQVPIVLGAVVPIYNIKGVRQSLNFTSDILAGIYLGKIKRWNDRQIKAANPGAALPDAEIAVVHRSDGSGTSFVWSDYLSKVSAGWKAGVGAGDDVKWRVGIGAEHNEGVASTVQRTENSIGYVELVYAIQHQLRFGAVRNAGGEFIKADLASVTEAARSVDNSDADSRVSITASPGKYAYPISSYTWLLLNADVKDKDKKNALVELLRWMLTSGQKSCAALGYAPLPENVIGRALRSVDEIK